MASVLHAREGSGSSVVDGFRQLRAATVDLCRTLELEDYVVQSMPDVSPTKWHLAHTTWFFERFVLRPHLADYEPFDPVFDYLFNSYYNTVGTMHPRPQRGLLSRPAVATIMAFRRYVDDAVDTLLGKRADDEELAALVTLGINHEQQHQELLLTDIKHVFSVNPLKPAWRELNPPPSEAPGSLTFTEHSAATAAIGHAGNGFCFDNETPRHDELIHDHALADRLVTNDEFLDFIRAGGYTTPELWLSDGWATINANGWCHPFYWSDDLETEFTLAGTRALDMNAPVSHVSFYEADAFARWAGARLPTEAEWESAAENASVDGNLVEEGHFHPVAARAGARQFFGDVWEWTASPYVAYPGFKPLAGSLGEYNGKFMCNQMVLRGGSCVTPRNHIRATYRNFFPAAARWQFTGIRLAKNV